jgi:flagellar biosynthesis/type III secretory pathway protein FliH
MSAKDGKDNGNAIRPFMPVASTPTRPLGKAIPSIVTPEVTSPWSPKPVAEEAPRPIGPTAEQLAQIIDDARAQGLAEGLAETERLRGELARLVDQLGRATEQVIAPTADAIADAALCVIDVWFGRADRAAQVAPVIRAWLDHAAERPADPDDPAHAAPAPVATVRVPPSDVAAVRAAIADALAAAGSDARLDVVGDAKLSPGAIAIASPGLELSHSWQARLPDLRSAIVQALVGTDDAEDPADA